MEYLIEVGIALRLLNRCGKSDPGMDVREVIENLPMSLKTFMLSYIVII